MLGSLDGSLKATQLIIALIQIYFLPIYLVFPLALSALELEDKLLGGLGLLPQDRFGLTSESLLLAVISDILRSQDLLITF